MLILNCFYLIKELFETIIKKFSAFASDIYDSSIYLPSDKKKLTNSKTPNGSKCTC